MAVKVRMGEKELLQAMKQAVVMLMLDSQGGEDGDSDEDDASPGDGEEEDSADSDEDEEHGEPLAVFGCFVSVRFLCTLLEYCEYSRTSASLGQSLLHQASGCSISQHQIVPAVRAGQSRPVGGRAGPVRDKKRAGGISPSCCGS